MLNEAQTKQLESANVFADIARRALYEGNYWFAEMFFRKAARCIAECEFPAPMHILNLGTMEE